MATTMHLARSARHANESAEVSGAKTQSVNNVQHPDQIISAGTEEGLALGAFKDHQMQSLAMVSDQDVEVQFLGVRYNVVNTVIGPPGTIDLTGDVTDMIYPGDLVRLEGTAADDGVYLVATSIFGAPAAATDTRLTLALGQALPAGGGGAVGTVARVCTQEYVGYNYDDTLAGYTVTAVTGAITVTGDLSDKFAAGEFVEIFGSTGNDGLWLIDSVAFVAPTTTIIVTPPGGGAAALPDNTNDGGFVKVRPAILLPAGDTYLWDVEGGCQNPFIQPSYVLGAPPAFNADRGDVSVCMVNCAGAVNAQFDARIALNPDIF